VHQRRELRVTPLARRAFRFTPVGAAYQLDDVYLDPWKGT